jgi:hypothetical protein
MLKQPRLYGFDIKPQLEILESSADLNASQQEGAAEAPQAQSEWDGRRRGQPMNRRNSDRYKIHFVSQPIREPSKSTLKTVVIWQNSWPRPPDYPDPSGLSPTAEELIAAIGLKPRNLDFVGHVNSLKNLSGPRINSAKIAFVAFQGCVPELTFDPGDPSDEAIGLDGAKDCPRVRIDLTNLPAPVIPHPKWSFGPREPRVTAAPRRGDCAKHTATRWIDSLNAILGDLKEVLAVKGGSCVGSNIDRAHWVPAFWIKGIQFVSGCKPDVLTVIGDSIDAVGSRKGTVLTDDLSGWSLHISTLII